MATVPSSNVTVSPFGIEPPVDVTVAVNVTDCPTKDGEPDEVTLVVVVIRVGGSSVCTEGATTCLFPPPEAEAGLAGAPVVVASESGRAFRDCACRGAAWVRPIAYANTNASTRLPSFIIMLLPSPTRRSSLLWAAAKSYRAERNYCSYSLNS